MSLFSLTFNTLKNSVLSWMTALVKQISQIAVDGAKDVKAQIIDLGADGVGLNIKTVVKNFSNHKAGVGLCLKDIISAEKPMQIASEIGKIGSLLGIETTLADQLVVGAAGLLRNEPVDPPRDLINLHGLEEAVPAAGMLLTLMGKEVADIDVSHFVAQNANNVKNVKILVDNLQKAGESLGLVKSSNYELLIKLNEKALSLKEELKWLSTVMAVDGVQVCTPLGVERVRKFELELKEVQSILHTTSNTTLKNNAIYSTCQQINVEASKLIVLAEQLQRQKVRVKPVGVCFHGTTELGKTQLYQALIDKIKKYFRDKMITNLGNVENWQTWYVQWRDEYDTGYFGQEIMYVDDAFQDKSCKDHLMYYGFISNGPIGMVMARESEKGRPFNGKLVITSTNKLPTQSLTVNDISALHTRFPITVHVEKKKMFSTKYDPEFSHLTFKMCHMREAVADPNAGDEISLNEIAENIAEQLIINHEFWCDVMKAHYPTIDLRTEPDDVIYYNPPEGFEDEEDLEILPAIMEEDEEDIPIPEPEPQVVQNPIQEIEPQEEQVQIQGPAQRMPYVRVGMGNGLDAIQRQILESLLRSFDNPVLEDPLLLGNWVKSITRRADGKSGYWVIINERPSAFDFILSLGAYDMPDTPEFKTELSQTGFVKVSHLETEYVWSPYFMGGAQLLLVHDEVRVILVHSLIPRWKRYVLKKWSDIRILWSGERTRRAMQRFLVGRIAIQLIPEAMHIPAGLMANNWLVLLPNFMPVNRFYNHIIICERMSDRWFEFLTTSLENLKNIVNQSLIRVLELIGVDITPFINEVCKTITEVAIQSLVLIITLLLLYAIYRLIVSFLPKKEILTEHSPRTTNKPAKKFTLSNKRVQLRNYVDDENCTKDEVDNYTVIHDGKSKETFENKDYIDMIFEVYSQGEGITMTGELVKPYNSCYRVLVSDVSDTPTTGISAIKKYKLDPITKVLLISVDLNGESTEEIKDLLDSMLERYKELTPHDYEVFFTISKEDQLNGNDNYFLRLDFIYRNRMQGGSVVNYVKKLVNSKSGEKDDFNGDKKKTNETVDSILHLGEQAGLTTHRTVKTKHSVLISKLPISDLDSPRLGDRSLGVGSGSYIYFNEHMAQMNQIIRFWHTSMYSSDTGDYQLAKVITVDHLRDLAKAKILSREEAMVMIGSQCRLLRMASVKKVFPDLRNQLYDLETFLTISKGCAVMVHLPKNAIDVPGYARDQGVATYNLDDKNQVKVSHYLKIDRISQNAGLSVPGDCGGVITNISDRYVNKMMGFFSAGSTQYWYGTYLVQEDIIDGINEYSEVDEWQKMILDGKPKDLPQGKECQFIGRLIKPSPPVFKTTLSHWHESPWSDEFEKQMEPSPLSANDSRITAEIMKNQEQQPSLLMEQNSKMCCELPAMDKNTLKLIEDQYVKEYAAKLSIKKVPYDMDELLHLALNGDKDNTYVTTISTNKSAGLPWTLTPNMKKNNYINVNPITGELTFNDTVGQCLKKRIVKKLTEAKSGRRIISFSNSKVKDALVKLKHVPIGKVRVYHCIAVDKIVSDSALFGNFKEAFMKQFVNMNHAVGADPHTFDWNVIAEKMKTHPNYFDVDFENYDKYLHGELMQTVFNIIRRVIQVNAPDEWDVARSILAEESIETYVVDYDTVYKTKRGNKSGEFLTTIVNCIANDILSFYVWIKSTKNTDIQLFRENVSVISFGDDKIESVSDEFAQVYNYMCAKKVLEEVGHRITPGSKDGIEQPFTSFENLQFLKRSFKEMRGKWVAPLIKRSIESPFVWTQILESEHEIWVELIKQTLDEALLHSEDYFYNICSKLQRCDNESLKTKISHIIARDYNAAVDAYFLRYMRR